MLLKALRAFALSLHADANTVRYSARCVRFSSIEGSAQGPHHLAETHFDETPFLVPSPTLAVHNTENRCWPERGAVNLPGTLRECT